MDLVKKIYENLKIDKKENPFVKKASKTSTPLSHFGVRSDLDYDYEGENQDKKKEVVKDENFDKKREAILDVIEAPNMFENLPNRWKVVAAVTGLKNPEAAFKNYDSYVNLSDRGRCALAYTKESDHKVNEWYNLLMNKEAEDKMTKEEAFDKLLLMISNDVKMRIKWQVEDPIGEKSASEMTEIVKEIEEIGSPDDLELVKMYKEKFASKKEAAVEYLYLNIYDIDQAYGGPEEGGWYYQTRNPIHSQQIPANTAHDSIELMKNHLKQEFHADENDAGTRYRVNGGADRVLRVEDHPAKGYPAFKPRYESKKTADSINDENNTQTLESYTESIGDQRDDGDIEKNHVHGSPFDNNKSIVNDALDAAPTPPVYAPSSSDGLLFDTIQRQDPGHEIPIDDDPKEFQGVNGRKKAILASMQKSGQQWEYFQQALTKLKSLDGKPMLRSVFDEGYYPILKDMIDKGFAELKKIKVSGTTSQINMTPQGKLALTAVEEKIKMQQEQAKPKVETVTEPETVSPDAAGEELPGEDDVDQNAPTEEIPLVMPVASKKTYSINDISEFAPHIASTMVKMGIMFVDKKGFDKKYAAYLEQVKDVPQLNDAMLERKAAELEISKNAYRKISYAQQGIKVFSHDDFVEKSGIAKAKLYQYKDPGTYVKVGDDEFVVAKITDAEIFLKKAQTGYNSDEEMETEQETLPENAYRNNKTCKFMVYEKKKDGEPGEKGKELGFDRSHKGARMRGIDNGEGNYVVEVINELVGPSSSNTGAPETYGVYEFEVRKMPSGGSYPSAGDHLMVMNYHQLPVGDPATHVTKLVQEKKTAQAQNMGKVLTVYPPEAMDENEVLSWAFNNKTRMGFEYDDQSMTENSVNIYAQGVDEKVLEQRLMSEGIDYLVSDLDPSKVKHDMLARKAKVTKTAESALKALFKACERVARDLSDGSRMFTSPEDRKLVRAILDFVDTNMDGLARLAGASEQEKQNVEEVVEEAKEEVSASPTEETVEGPGRPITTQELEEAANRPEPEVKEEKTMEAGY